MRRGFQNNFYIFVKIKKSHKLLTRNMKKIYSFFSLFALVLFIENNAFAQCPGCAVNTSCIITPAYPGTCPADTMPVGIVGQSYNQDITFYMPENFEVTSPITQMVHLDELIITNVAGLPNGLSWQTNSANNTYHPSSGNEHGCAKVCGTPQFPGTFNVTIYFQVTVTPQSLGGVTTQNQSTTMVLIVTPGASGNSAFIISSPQGCASHSTGFTPMITSGGSPLYTYSWDFGNGNSSTLENPPMQNYLTAGTYLVSQTTNVLEYRLSNVVFNVGSNTNWCGDIEEPSVFGTCTGSPDIIFELRDNASALVYSGAEVSNSMTARWGSLNLPVQSGPYSIQFWDADPTSANDNLGIFTITPTATGTFSFSGGGVSGNYTIGTQIVNTLSDTDSVTVYPLPPVLTLSFVPADSVCSNQPVTLSVPDGYNYQWYNDTTLLFNAVDSSLILSNANGNYWVKVSNQYGCSSSTAQQNIEFIPVPPKPNFWITGNTLNNALTGVSFQWFENGVLIPGATNNTYTATTSNYYSLVASNSFGCSNTSDTVFVTVSGINERVILSDISIFPNPNNGAFTISFDLITSADLIITITDLLGNNVYQKKEEEYSGKYDRSINLSDLGKGMYLFNLQAGKQQVNKRFVIH